MTASVADPACDFTVAAVENVSRHYGRRRALSRVSVTCRTGSVLGLFGPNGSGKSTLLGILSTLVQPSTGRVLYGDRNADDWGDTLRSRIGVLGHDLFLYADLTARENLTFFAHLHGVPDVAATVTRGLAHARLSDRGDDRVGTFSRGLRQRLALERALIHLPRLLLLDEPFTGLDDASAALLVERLRQIRAAGAIIVMATHDFDLAEGLTDDALCLANGRVIPMARDGGTLRQRYRAAVAQATS
ncbi:MAG: ABC transporter ATP-binding protein [Vicinamibacterales bacterium]